MSHKTLFLFTNSFPYGKGESFLENELPYLAKTFKDVIIIPTNKYSSLIEKRNIKETNVSIMPYLFCSNKFYFILGLLKVHYKSFLFFVKIIFNYNLFSSSQIKPALIAYSIINNILYSSSFKNFKSIVKTEDVIYFYWGAGAVYILPFIKDIQSRKIVRLHGSDLYFAPVFHNKILESADKLVFISEHGRSYYDGKYGKSTKHIVSRLGTIYHGTAKRSTDKIFRIISCSFVTQNKNLQLLYHALQLIDDKQIEWIHIGDGSEFEELKLLAGKSKSNIKISLLGYINNENILNYYKSNPIDVFINVSFSEGIPVSIMEAISFNIPVIAPDVGGVSEIVNDNTGILMSSIPAKEEVANAINSMISENEKYKPHEFWRKHYDAESNYSIFGKKISE